MAAGPSLQAVSIDCSGGSHNHPRALAILKAVVRSGGSCTQLSFSPEPSFFSIDSLLSEMHLKSAQILAGCHFQTAPKSKAWEGYPDKAEISSWSSGFWSKLLTRT